MSNLEFFALDAVATLIVTFCAVRRIATLLFWGVVIIAVFVGLTGPSLPAGDASEWFVTSVGLGAWLIGLAVVRAMLTRSVSLRMMARLDAHAARTYDRDLRSRLDELRRLHLVRRADGVNTLTVPGRTIGAIVAASYRAVRIRT
jgi:hypothetical protein